MGKNVSKKKTKYGDMVEEVLVTDTPTPTVEQESTPTVESEYTVTVTPEYTPKYTANKKTKERKTERLQLTVRPSTKARLAKYAEDHDTSSNEVVQRLLDTLLDEAGY